MRYGIEFDFNITISKYPQNNQTRDEVHREFYILVHGLCGGDGMDSDYTWEVRTSVMSDDIRDVIEQRDEDLTMKSERDGDYSYVRDGVTSAIDRHWKDLLLYSRKAV